MTDRIIDVSEQGAYLRCELEQLLIERGDGQRVSVPLSDLAVLLIAHPQISCTQAALAGLMSHGAALVVADRNALPVGMMLPLVAHSTQGERFLAQAAAPLPRKKRIWQKLVRTKIAAQAALLEQHRGHDGGLRELVRLVRSGDPQNVEARAAQRYWPLLFDDPGFRRRRDAPDANRMLNYGYAVLRAAAARAICAAGLHPSLGVHHHNRYDPYCLADDLMEPYRPLVDAAVLETARAHGDAALLPSVKRAIIEPLTGRYRHVGEVRTLFDWLARAAGSLASALMGEANRFELPELLNREDSADAV